MSCNKRYLIVALLAVAALLLPACKGGQTSDLPPEPPEPAVPTSSAPAPITADNADTPDAPVENQQMFTGVNQKKGQPLSPDDFVVDNHPSGKGNLITTTGLHASDVGPISENQQSSADKAPPLANRKPSNTRTSSRSNSSSTATSRTTSSGSSLGASTAFSVEAMVGQVNGRPMYASEVFEPMHEQLKRLGETLTRPDFRDRAGVLIAQRLRQQIIDALVLGEAEQQLSEEQRYGILQYLKEQREELIRKFGEGSAKLAGVTLREEQGITLDQKIEQTRQQVIVQSYMREKLLPKVNVTRKDIARYYERNKAEFNPPPGRTIHMIQVARKSTAQKIDDMLKEGTPFLDIASDKKLNDYYPEKFGQFGEGPVEGDEVFGPKDLNEALLSLSQGEYSQRINLKLGSSTRYTWLYLKKLSAGESTSLEEAQAQIEAELRQRQFATLTREYQAKLFEKGSYNAVEGMLTKLLEIAMNVYARPK